MSLRSLHLLRTPEIAAPRAISFPELRSPWPGVGKRELWKHPFHACAIACIDADWDCAVSRITRIRLFAFVISKWMIPELSFSDGWSRGTKLWERDYSRRVLPQSLVFQSMVKGNEDSGNEKIWRSFSPYFPQNTLMLSDSVGVPIICILFLDFVTFFSSH